MDNDSRKSSILKSVVINFSDFSYNFHIISRKTRKREKIVQ